eukprot:TRINITY_DN403_c1_g1_i1.p1 TRINITY_DN403_c1_g1~~TRINITY_DN403_c1_g1_i1.p1  ORF type:complete len:475 (+),score=90.49 TRINITY_DN403_c1_g1_i1:1-1425(+)
MMVSSLYSGETCHSMLSSVTIQELIDIALAADYFQLKSLFGMCASKLVALIKDEQFDQSSLDLLKKLDWSLISDAIEAKETLSSSVARSDQFEVAQGEFWHLEYAVIPKTGANWSSSRTTSAFSLLQLIGEDYVIEYLRRIQSGEDYDFIHENCLKAVWNRMEKLADQSRDRNIVDSLSIRQDDIICGRSSASIAILKQTLQAYKDNAESAQRTPAQWIHEHSGIDPLDMLFVFCIHPGRCGSKYLAALFAAAGFHAQHEPTPQMNGEHLRSALKDGLMKTFGDRLKQKGMALIEGTQMYNTFPVGVYVETSSMFIKTFYDVVCEALCSENENSTVANMIDGSWSTMKDERHMPKRYCSLITLRRYLPLVVKSQYESGWCSDLEPESRWKTPGASMFAYSTDEVEADVLHKRPAFATSSVADERLDKIISYNIDIEIRAQRLKATYKNNPYIKFVDVRLEELNSVEGEESFMKV